MYLCVNNNGSKFRFCSFLIVGIAGQYPIFFSGTIRILYKNKSSVVYTIFKAI